LKGAEQQVMATIESEVFGGPGSRPVHATHDSSVNSNFFADLGQPKYWVRDTSPMFGVFLYYTLDKVV
jgi:hypothetical protein